MINFALIQHRWLSLVALATGVVSCSSVDSQIHNELNTKKLDSSVMAAREGGVKFSQVLDKNIRSKTDPRRADFFKIAEQGLATRGTSKQKYWSDLCDEKYPKEAGCGFLKPNWYKVWLETDFEDQASAPNLKLPVEKLKKRKRDRPLVETLAKNLREGIWQPLPKQKPGDYYRALKTFSSWTDGLAAVEKAVLQPGVCAPSELYNFLGLKSEEFFPSKEYLARSVGLYTRANECGENTKYTLNARFRLGLLSILQEDCGTARPVFEKVAEGVMNDYSSRARYWIAWCAKDRADKVGFFQLYDSLFRSNPLGFHTISLVRGDKMITDNLGQPLDPIVMMRTNKDPKIDAWLELLEQMDLQGRKDIVRSLLIPVRLQIEDLSKLDPAIRLYISTFAYRANDTLALFRILDSVFRTQAEYIVDSTLKLFYPLEQMDLIVQHAGKLNPLLIAALIRQESAFAVHARSPVGAMGLMQLMPATARIMKHGVRKKDLLRPEINIEIGTKYFENLIKRFDGDVELALASYNAGPEVVDRWVARYPRKNRMLFLDLIPYSETRNYVTLIGRNYYWYSQLYRKQMMEKWGLAKIEPTTFSAYEPL